MQRSQHHLAHELGTESPRGSNLVTDGGKLGGLNMQMRKWLSVTTAYLDRIIYITIVVEREHEQTKARDKCYYRNRIKK